MTQTQFVIFALLAVGCFSGTRAGHWAPNFNIWGWGRKKPQLSAVAPSAKPLIRVPSAKRAAPHAVDKRSGTLRKKTTPAVNVARDTSRDTASGSRTLSSSDTSSFVTASSSSDTTPFVTASSSVSNKSRRRRNVSRHNPEGFTVIGSSGVFKRDNDDKHFSKESPNVVTLDNDQQAATVDLSNYSKAPRTLMGVHFRELGESNSPMPLFVDVLYHSGTTRRVLVNPKFPDNWRFKDGLIQEDVKVTGVPPDNTDGEGEDCAEVDYEGCMASVDLSNCGGVQMLYGVFPDFDQQNRRLRFVVTKTAWLGEPVVVTETASTSQLPEYCNADRHPGVHQFLNREGTDFLVWLGKAAPTVEEDLKRITWQNSIEPNVGESVWQISTHKPDFDNNLSRFHWKRCYAIFQTLRDLGNFQKIVPELYTVQRLLKLKVVYADKPAVWYTKQIPMECPLKRAVVNQWDGTLYGQEVFVIEEDKQIPFGQIGPTECKAFFNVAPESHSLPYVKHRKLYVKTGLTFSVNAVPDQCDVEQYHPKLTLLPNGYVVEVGERKALTVILRQ